MNRIVAIIFLFLNALVVLPSSIWHQCDHAIDANHSDQQSISENNDCLICDHTFSTSFSVNSSFTAITTSVAEIVWIEKELNYFLETTPYALGRAPPVVA